MENSKRTPVLSKQFVAFGQFSRGSFLSRNRKKSVTFSLPADTYFWDTFENWLGISLMNPVKQIIGSGVYRNMARCGAYKTAATGVYSAKA